MERFFDRIPAAEYIGGVFISFIIALTPTWVFLGLWSLFQPDSLFGTTTLVVVGGLPLGFAQYYFAVVFIFLNFISWYEDREELDEWGEHSYE